MSKQATALSQLAQASLTQSKSMQQIAEASHQQVSTRYIQALLFVDMYKTPDN